jgi:hypothetical protein
MPEDRDRLLPSRVHGALSKSGKNRLDRLSRQFRRNIALASNNRRGACFNVLEVFQSFPGAEADGVGTPRFFLDAQEAQRELNSWASTVVPAQRTMLQNALAALQNQPPDTPLEPNALVNLFQQVIEGLDVFRHCPHLAPTSAPPPSAPVQDAELGD